MRRFAGIDRASERIPDETTILAFLHLLEKHNLCEHIIETVKANLKANAMAMNPLSGLRCSMRKNARPGG
jgi:IS5 family transposase